MSHAGLRSAVTVPDKPAGRSVHLSAEEKRAAGETFPPFFSGDCLQINRESSKLWREAQRPDAMK